MDSKVCSQWDEKAVTVAGGGLPGNSPSQLNNPHQIAMDSSGKLYIYDAGNGRIQIVDGSSVSTWSHLNEKLLGNCLFIDDHGTLYIENGATKSIMRWTNGRTLAEETKCRPSACANMFVDSTTNDIYIADHKNHQVIKCTSDGKQFVVAGATGEYGTSANKLYYPRGIFVDEESRDIFIADKLNDRIIKWSQFIREGITVHSLSRPNSLIKDNNNVFYVIDGSHRIVRLNPGSTIIAGVSGNRSQ